jgi:hypothetical protein
MKFEQRIAYLMLRSTPEERQRLFSRVSELQARGVRLDKRALKELERYRQIELIRR